MAIITMMGYVKSTIWCVPPCNSWLHPAMYDRFNCASAQLCRLWLWHLQNAGAHACTLMPRCHVYCHVAKLTYYTVLAVLLLPSSLPTTVWSQWPLQQAGPPCQPSSEQLRKSCCSLQKPLSRAQPAQPLSASRLWGTNAVHRATCCGRAGSARTTSWPLYSSTSIHLHVYRSRRICLCMHTQSLDMSTVSA